MKLYAQSRERIRSGDGSSAELMRVPLGELEVTVTVGGLCKAWADPWEEPRSRSSHEWRNKYICVEEPFERNNVARAVHEKIKFDAIKAQFAESCQILRERKDLNSILPVRAIINKESSRR
ncbi:poly(A) RNA polymerase GLD2 [Lates japonicus]|uniref:Poly(A) RNA polymerase GLD2 n=1 Tax=Lates japonicus TaxID=270547 RepID=A0AAD3NE01_LATJO|nr:poly(A) RNA polymerase GLD2 [Lates japonicus]